VTIGKDLQVSDLRKIYSAVVIATGASVDKEIGLDNEKLIIGATKVVNWYNSSIDSDLNIKDEFNLQEARDMLVIGNGNIFCDIARVMLKNPDEFLPTCMHSNVIEALKKSKITNI
jgi:ferredoxin/flavodoxin---NADP+ reductase